MKQIKIACPAKINLTLEILNKREDCFHNIQSIMQAIDLFDYLNMGVEDCDEFQIELSGTSDEIPYDESNLVHKAILLFAEKVNLSESKIIIHIEKNIPVSAGLAGGSTDAAGALYGLNKLFNEPLSSEQLHQMCAKLGSDLNFCLEGGCQLATGRGEMLEKLPFVEMGVSLIKPNDLGISAKEAYTKFSQLKIQPSLDMTGQMVNYHRLYSPIEVDDVEQFLHNDLELALFNDYKQFQKIKRLYPNSIMSGSGSTYFALDTKINPIDNYWVKNDLKTVDCGVSQVD